MITIPSSTSLANRFGAKLSGMASQVAVAVVATGLTTSLFTAPRATPPQGEAQAKIAMRVPDAAEPAPVLALYPREAAALANLATFKPTAAFVSATAEETALTQVAAVLPPRRPTQTVLDSLAPQPAAAPLATSTPIKAAVEPNRAEASTGVRVAGLTIAMPSLDLVRYVPRGGEFVRDLSRKTLSTIDRLTHVAFR